MNLTPRQTEILELLSEGMVPKQVATHLGCSLETVKWHTKIARATLGARNTTHAVAIYMRAKKASRPTLLTRFRLVTAGRRFKLTL